MLLVYDVIRSEPRGPTKKKKYNKTCCNQNMPALPLSDDLYSLLLRLFMKYSSPALIQTEQRGHDKKKI